VRIRRFVSPCCSNICMRFSPLCSTLSGFTSVLNLSDIQNPCQHGHSNMSRCSRALNFVSHTAEFVELNQAVNEVLRAIRCLRSTNPRACPYCLYGNRKAAHDEYTLHGTPPRSRTALRESRLGPASWQCSPVHEHIPMFNGALQWITRSVGAGNRWKFGPGGE
jgi:hypothetical protein